MLNFCLHSQLNESADLKDFLESIYAEAAQYNEPPTYPVNVICSAIDGASVGTDTLGRVYAGVVAYLENRTCYDMNEFNQPTETNQGWRWQVASFHSSTFTRVICTHFGIREFLFYIPT